MAETARQVLFARGVSAPADHVTHHEMCAVGISYRQMHHWCARGYLRPDNPNPGSGVPMTFPPEELRVAGLMGALTKAGMLPEFAETFARQGWLELDGGVRLVIQ